MASTIDKLYSKYAGRVQRYMEDDAYYQYLLEMISGGKTTIIQHNRVLDKTVDETWLTAIEAALPGIHEIIAHPRKFLKTNENLLPVEKVKKIGPDSVRHLASHTQYISGIRGGMVYPGKVLAVENDESIDLYENRFVATLIRKISEFIERRTGAIFWDTGDEEQSILKVESRVEDDYEEISYKLEMVVKNKQTYMENDGSKMDVFKRIDRVRRVVSDFRASTFMQVMGDLPSVQSPVQRTNQITKNPNYRACYDLWQFLERYDQVGYQIDVRETALDFDEDYLFQMYGNVAMNYTVFKSLLEHDNRRITEAPRRRKTVKPKFIKQIVEQFVDDYDIPDVEIRQVIIEEVARAQGEIDRRTREKEAEREKIRKAKEKERERAAAEKAREKAKLAAQKEREKAKLAAQKAKEKEKAKLAAQKEKEKAKLAAQKLREKERAKLAAQKELELAKLAAQKEKEQELAKLAAQKATDKELARQASLEATEKAKEMVQKEIRRQRQSKQTFSISPSSLPKSARAAAPVPEDPTRVMVGRPDFIAYPDVSDEDIPFLFPYQEELPPPLEIFSTEGLEPTFQEEAPALRKEPAKRPTKAGQKKAKPSSKTPKIPSPSEASAPEPEVVATVEPEVIVATEPETVATVEPEVIVATEPEVIVATEPETVATVEPEVIVATEPETVATVEPEAPEAAVPELPLQPPQPKGASDLRSWIEKMRRR